MSNGCCNTCGCNNGTCGCSYNVFIGGDTPTAYNFQSIGLTGIPVLDGVSGLNVNFRTISSANAGLQISLDAGNHAVLLTLDIPAIVAQIPAASTTVSGIQENATDAESLAKSATDKTLTPSNLAALGSSTTFAGLVELATDAEAITGTSTTLAITPANLTAVTDTLATSKVFADAVARAASAPDFIGQFGGQVDTGSSWFGYGLAAGQWRQILSNATDFILASGGVNVTIGTSSTWTFDGISVVHTIGAYGFNGTAVSFSNGILDFSNSTITFSGGGTNPDSLIGTDAAGIAQALAISNFVSTLNTQTGYTAFANGAILRTCDTTTVTLPQLAQIVGTLINDLKAVRLPAN